MGGGPNVLDEPGGLERTLRRANFGITASGHPEPAQRGEGPHESRLGSLAKSLGRSGTTRVSKLVSPPRYFAFTRSARFRSRSFCSITLTSGKFFLSASRKSAALPTITTLVGRARYSWRTRSPPQSSPHRSTEYIYPEYRGKDHRRRVPRFGPRNLHSSRARAHNVPSAPLCELAIRRL